MAAQGAGGMRMRLDRQPGEEIDRSQPITFSWNGRTVGAYSGDTIVSALAATGERVFSRSFKYHRPRGLLTADYLDPGCFFQVGDEPNVRGAHRLAAPGMQVRSQNAWPSVRFDVKAANELLGPFLGAGFYYKTFIRPRRLWPAYERMLQQFIHAGSVSEGTPRAAGRPGWPRRSPRRGPGPPSCWWRRSIFLAGTCGGAQSLISPRFVSCGLTWRPQPGSRS